MRIKIVLEFASEAEASAALHKLATSIDPPAEVAHAVPTTPAAPSRRGRPRKASLATESAPQNVEETQPAAAQPEPAQGVTGSEEAKLPPHATLDDLRALIAQVVTATNLETAHRIVRSAGVERISDIAPEKFKLVAIACVDAMARKPS